MSSDTSTNERIFVFTLLGFTFSGATVGLVVGAVTYLPTAPVAALELGIPSAFLGAICASLAVGIRIGWTKMAHHR